MPTFTLQRSHRMTLVCIALPVIFGLSCRRASVSNSHLNAEPLASRRPVSRDSRDTKATSERLFASVSPKRSGIDFVNVLDDQTIWGGDFRPVLNGSLGSGTCVGDINNDGQLDVYLVGRQCPNRLYLQQAPFEFEDFTQLTQTAGGEGICAGASLIDIDNDGDLDIYLCKYDAPNCLYINERDGSFPERAKEFGLDFRGASVSAAFCDYDRDGDLDLHLVTNRLFITDLAMQLAKRRIRYENGQAIVPDDVQEIMYFAKRRNGNEVQYIAVPAGQRDLLYRNEGDGTFVDVSTAAGLKGNYRGHSAVWWDFNDDAWPDLYVANDFYDPDQLYRNNGDGTFTDVTQESLPHTPWYSMGANSADINNDGRPDLLATDMSATTHFQSKLSMGSMSEHRWFLESAEPRQYMRNALFLNTGSTRFMEIAHLAGVASTDWTWATCFADVDLDGRTDVFFTNGMIRNTMDSDLRQQGARQGAQRKPQVMSRLLRASEPLREANLAFRNMGNLKFQNVSQPWGIDHVGISTSAVFADLDNDGDQDLVVNHYNETTSVYENLATDHHSVSVRLRGSRSNRYGIGAKVTLRIDEDDKSADDKPADGKPAVIGGNAVVQTKYVTANGGYMSTCPTDLQFGLGTTSTVQSLTIRWPSGVEQTVTSLAANHRYEIIEPIDDDSIAEPMPPHEPATPKMATVASPAFVEASQKIAPKFVHREGNFDDFSDQPLLPYRTSRLGGGLACGDANGDGRDDVFFAGASGHAGSLYLFDTVSQTYVEQPGPWAAHADREDMAALWIDADTDGDNDLVVSSGFPDDLDNTDLRGDRLYINEGNGTFRFDEAGLPAQDRCSSALAAADLDRDGDLDLFVGGRVTPGKYPTPAASAILENIGGRFEDATEKWFGADGLQGMITGALWTDVDDDGLIDLLVTTEWGPIRYYHNHGERLVEQTEQAGLATATGWWNGLCGADLDSDGDIDYVATNLGLNTKYHADVEHPAVMFFGDVDGSGLTRIIEAKYEGDQLLPIRGKSCSSSAIPSLVDKFPTYRAFASADLMSIYSADRLQACTKLSANVFAHLVLLNNGNGEFDLQPLPRIAQASPAYGVACGDFSGDGIADIYLVQNFFSPEPETGKMDGGVSLLLTGKGDGSFQPQMPNTTGLIVPQDGVGLATLDGQQNGWADFIISTNNGPAKLFERASTERGSPLSVRLHGPNGNLPAAGARLSLREGSLPTRVAEQYAGAGYLSQSAPVIFLGRRMPESSATITVRWPDQTQQEFPLSPGQTTITLTHPDR